MKNKAPIDDYDFFTKIIQTINNNPLSVPFRKPVDEELDDAAGYYSIVLKPMDLSTVQTKLQKSFQDLARKRFLEDLDLIWSNAALYNGPTHPVTLQAEKLREIVEQLVTGINYLFSAFVNISEHDIKHGRQTPQPKKPKTETSVIKKVRTPSTPKTVKATATLQELTPISSDPMLLQVPMSPALVYTPDPELTFTEKQELCSLVQQLAVYPEEIEELIILIHTNCPNVFNGISEKYTSLELNLTILEPSFQIKLLSYVRERIQSKTKS